MDTFTPSFIAELFPIVKKIEKAHISIDRQFVIYTYNGILLSS